MSNFVFTANALHSRFLYIHNMQVAHIATIFCSLCPRRSLETPFISRQADTHLYIWPRARSLVVRFGRFHISLYRRFFLCIVRLNANRCTTVGSQGHHLQVGSAHAQKFMLLLIPIICGDPAGRAWSQPFIIRHHTHIIVLSLSF